MSRQTEAVARLSLSRDKLRLAMAESSAGNTAQSLLSGLVQRHPLGAAGLALVLGAWVAHSRPWRWLVKPALWAALLPQITTLLAGAPMGNWAELLAALFREPAPETEPETG